MLSTPSIATITGITGITGARGSAAQDGADGGPPQVAGLSRRNRVGGGDPGPLDGWPEVGPGGHREVLVVHAAGVVAVCRVRRQSERQPLVESSDRSVRAVVL